MTHDERRAEQLLSEIDTLARDFDLYEFGLPLDDETRDKMRVLVMDFARDAEARGIEEFVNEYEAHKLSWGGPVKSLLQFGREYLISKLREEGRGDGSL
jgi:hypothetical protein